MRRLAALAVALALALSALPAQPVAAQGARASALAPVRSPQPVRRPVLPEALAGLTAGPGGIARSPLPVPRPGGGPAPVQAQGPASMVPVAPPQIPAETPAAPPAPAAPVVPVIAGVSASEPLPPFAAGPDPFGPPAPDPAAPASPAPAQTVIETIDPAAVAAALDQALAASIPPPRPLSVVAAAAAPPAEPPADPRAVARSLTPAPRTAAAQDRHRAAAARLAAARPRATTPTPAAQPAPQAVPQATGPAGPGLCGDPALQGRRLSRITSQVQGCGIDEPVSLTHVHGIRLSTPATLHCDTARATGRWVRDVMRPAIGRTGGGITEIRVAAHYACRPRNNQRGARVSEHGRGRAIDISGFRLANGEQVVILRDYNRGPYSAALRRMRTGACGVFRTILGPGSDRFHADHFHFDMAQHRGGGTYCR